MPNLIACLFAFSARSNQSSDDVVEQGSATYGPRSDIIRPAVPNRPARNTETYELDNTAFLKWCGF